MTNHATNQINSNAHKKGPKSAHSNQRFLDEAGLTPSSNFSATYAFIDVFTDRILYVGGTTDIYGRTINNLSYLRGKRHCSKALQDHFNAFGEAGIKVTILAKWEAMNVDPAVLAEIETSFIKLSGTIGNTAKTAKAGTYSSNKGAKQKITRADIREIKRMIGERIPNVIIARVKGLSESVVSRIKNGFLDYRTPSSKPAAYRFISPEGKIVEGMNLIKFCEEHGLNQGNMWVILHGGRLSQHKGWRKAPESFGGNN